MGRCLVTERVVLAFLFFAIKEVGLVAADGRLAFKLSKDALGLEGHLRGHRRLFNREAIQQQFLHLHVLHYSHFLRLLYFASRRVCPQF